MEKGTEIQRGGTEKRHMERSISGQETDKSLREVTREADPPPRHQAALVFSLISAPHPPPTQPEPRSLDSPRAPLRLCLGCVLSESTLPPRLLPVIKPQFSCQLFPRAPRLPAALSKDSPWVSP